MCLKKVERFSLPTFVIFHVIIISFLYILLKRQNSDPFESVFFEVF